MIRTTKQDVTDVLNQNEMRKSASIAVEAILGTDDNLDSRVINSIIAFKVGKYLEQEKPWVLDELSIGTPQYDERVFISVNNVRGVHEVGSYVYDVQNYTTHGYSGISREDAVRGCCDFINMTVAEIVNEAVEMEEQIRTKL
jgi:hypothetical protein